MVDDILIKVLLLPLSLLYGVGVGLRNLLYRLGVLRSVRFDVPVISIGNLAIGGTGKSPHIEYLLGWLRDYLEVGLLSRGYGRGTVGFRVVGVEDTALSVGDEPLQIKRKFRDELVVVSESRALGIPEMIRNAPGLQCILLDDAFQHLAVTPGLNMLLTEYGRPFTRDWLLPSGRLREWRYGYRRADIVVVTKCPDGITEVDRQRMVSEIDPYPRQRIYFSRYRYGRLRDFFHPEREIELGGFTDALLVSGIANTDYLLAHLGERMKRVVSLDFADHHYYREEDLELIRRRFVELDSGHKAILTTEKDAVRLELHRERLLSWGLPIYVVCVAVEFIGGEENFKQDIRRFLLDFQV
jgi:tetraacyldisaccharide 4'-kinase